MIRISFIMIFLWLAGCAPAKNASSSHIAEASISGTNTQMSASHSLETVQSADSIITITKTDTNYVKQIIYRPGIKTAIHDTIRFQDTVYKVEQKQFKDTVYQESNSSNLGGSLNKIMISIIIICVTCLIIKAMTLCK